MHLHPRSYGSVARVAEHCSADYTLNLESKAGATKLSYPIAGSERISRDKFDPFLEFTTNGHALKKFESWAKTISSRMFSETELDVIHVRHFFHCENGLSVISDLLNKAYLKQVKRQGSNTASGPDWQ